MVKKHDIILEFRIKWNQLEPIRKPESSDPVKVWANAIFTESSPDDSQCEIAVSFLWVCLNVFAICNWEKRKNFKLTPWTFCEIFVRSSEDSPCYGSRELNVRVANSQKAHSNLTMWTHLVSSLCHQNKPTVRLFRWALCECVLSSHLQWVCGQPVQGQQYQAKCCTLQFTARVN